VTFVGLSRGPTRPTAVALHSGGGGGEDYGSGMRSTSDIIDTVLGGHDAVTGALRDAHSAAVEAVDPVVLEMCRVRIAMLLGNQDELASSLDDELVSEVPMWPSSNRLSAAQRACLAFTEEFVIDVASLSDQVAGAVIGELGEQGFADFVNGLLVIEQRQRMRLAWQRLFPEVSP
jgi:hypothetical protein